MHRLYTITALFVSTLLLSISAEARPGAGGHVRVLDGSTGAAMTDEGHKDWINLNKVTRILWAPGVESRNVKILGQPRRTSGRSYVINILDTGEAEETKLFLARAAETGRRLPNVVLTGRDRDGRPLRYELTSVLVLSVGTGAHGKKPCCYLKITW